MADDKDKIKTAEDLLKSIKARIELEGDYDNLLKSANRELKKMDDAYRRIDARLNSFYQGSINTKKVQNELYKSSQQRYVAEKRLSELEMSKSDYSKKLLQNEKTLESLLNSKWKTEKERDRILHQIQLNREKIASNVELQSIEYAKAQLKLAEQNSKAVKEKLNTERMVSRQMGLSGSIIGSIAKKLGYAEDAQEKMVTHSRNLVAQNGKVTAGFGVAAAGVKAIYQGMVNSWKSTSLMSKVAFGLGKIMGGIGLAIKAAGMAGNLLGSAMSKFGGIIKGLSPVSSNFVSDLVAPITGMIDKIPIVGGLLAGLVGFWASILDLVIGVEDYIVKSGRQIGLSATQAIKLNDAFQAAAANSEKLYVNSKALMDSQLELTKVSGLNNIASQKNLETNIELGKFAGIELETRGKIYEASIATKTSMESIAKSIVGQVANLRRTTGIAFNYQSIIKEAANQSGRLGLMFTKYPSQLAKSLVNVKALGLELKQLESIGDSMLDFESSISKEFEAQLLLGRDINMNKAREAFLNNDLVGAAAEITKYTGDANGFLKLNRIQQQSLADLMGMSVDGMSDFLKKQEIYLKTGTVNQQQLLKQVELSRQNTAEKKRMIALLGEENYQSLVNLSVQEKLMLSFDKIKQALVDFLTKSNILEKIQYYADWLTKPENIQNAVNTVKGVLSRIFNFVSGVTGVILDLVKELGTWLIFDDEKEKDFEDTINRLNKGQQDFNTDLQKNFQASVVDMKTEISNMSSGGEREESSSIFKRGQTAPKVKDAVIFPSSNMIINKDPLDYTIFVKNPAALSAPQGISQEAIEKIASAIMNRPVVVNTNTNLNLDGQIAARSNYTNMKNNPLIGFDKTFGQMSLNT